MLKDFSQAIREVYAAAAQPALWPVALQALADHFGDVGANLIFRRDDGSAATIVSPSLQQAQDDYASGWWRQDIRWLRAAEYTFRSNSGAITERHVVTPEEMATHPFFTDFQKRHGLMWIASVEISPDPRTMVALSVHRGRDKPPYSDEELKLFTEIGRHVEQALRLSTRIIQAEVANVGLGEALSRLSVGAFVVDRLGRVLFSNAAGERFLGDGLTLADKQLTASAPDTRQALKLAVAAAVAGAGETSAAHLRPLLIEREASPRPAVLYVLPLAAAAPPSFDDIIGSARALVLIVDPEPGEPADPAVVRDVLGLTLGEARVASLVGAGIAPRNAAARLGIAEETARSVLKRVFDKVGVSRQSELAALMTKLVLR